MVRGASLVAQILYQLSHKGSPRILEWVAYPFSRGSSRPRNRLSCRDQEGRRGSEEAVPGPSVFPSREPSVSGNFCGRIKGVK